MRGLAIRLGVPLVLLAVASQLVIPPYLEHRIANRLTEHGGSAKVELSAFPAARLLFGGAGSLKIRAHGLSVDLTPGQEDVFKRLDRFGDVDVVINASRAGPFSVRTFRMHRVASKRYAVALSAEATAGDVARYAGAQLAGGFGQALAGLATSALGGFQRPIPVQAAMVVDTSTQPPTAVNVSGAVDGLPAGPLEQIVANALLGTL